MFSLLRFYGRPWWEKPRNFSRSYLPRELATRVALPGTIHIFEYSVEKLKDSLQKVPEFPEAPEIETEDEIRNYLQKHLDELEQGLMRALMGR